MVVTNVKTQERRGLGELVGGSETALQWEEGQSRVEGAW